MRFGTILETGILLRRYKRFLADVQLDGGRRITAHVANTGAMTGCAEPGAQVALSYHQNPGRKLPWSWELVRVGRFWAGVNTARTNAIVAEAIEAGHIPDLCGAATLRREVASRRGSRIDFVLEGSPGRTWIEVKNVTLAKGGLALFPDAVTARGARHLRELRRLRRRGDRAAVFFFVNRGDCEAFSPAAAIDPFYARLLWSAAEEGVLVLAYSAAVGLGGIRVARRLPVSLRELC